jgi:hypothetical protein
MEEQRKRAARERAALLMLIAFLVVFIQSGLRAPEEAPLRLTTSRQLLSSSSLKEMCEISLNNEASRKIAFENILLGLSAIRNGELNIVNCSTVSKVLLFYQ